ncbi:MAG: myo-inositol-1-phosphate synthase [Zestosphaera tikiterensis]|uniref:Myo-inositol-1-phosphate synthase n=1 Tax=Zestosphaera tikiterensis TaxID=1973259 RepID=A0A2R7YAQ4_9CREN|nr:MAG: myo-inositol-1-phosphate synthase [Zestosphaera tikiterensis]
MSIKVVLLGAGYVATHLAVGLERLKKRLVEPYGIPLANYKLPYKIEDIEIVGVYDVDNSKVGKSLYEIATQVMGSDYPIPEELKKLKVSRGVHRDSTKGMGFSATGLDDVRGVPEAVDVLVSEWLSLKPDVVVNVITTEYGNSYPSKEVAEEYILSGKSPATHVYAYITAKYASKVGQAAFVNAIPTPVANNDGLLNLLEESGVVVFGDDGATGATPLTADILEHMFQRNRKVEFIVQFNIGGNTDFYALTLEDKNKMKEITKSSMVKDILGYETPTYIKPTGYLEPLGDKKYVAMHLEYISFNGFRDSIYINARINDSPALAGILVDLIRIGKIALDRGVRGTVYPVNAFFMKKPGPNNSRNIAKTRAYYELLRWLGLK